MAKKDTYLALLRRGIDDTTAQQLADSGLKIGDLKKIDKDMLIENYGLKADIADGVISIIAAGPQSHGKERYLSKVLAPEKKQESKIALMIGLSCAGNVRQVSPLDLLTSSKNAWQTEPASSSMKTNRHGTQSLLSLHQWTSAA
jgi:hypothetical protein